MADGMQFIFQIDANTPGLDDLLGKLDKANVSLGKGHQGLKGLDEGARRAGKGAEEAGDAFDKALHKGLEPFLHKAKEIAEFEFIREGTEKLLEFPEQLADKVKELTEEILDAAAKEERLGRAFQNALGPEVGKEASEYFEAIADKTEFTHDQIKGMGLELAKSGFQGENLKNAIAAAADLASMTENPVAGGMEAVEALRRIMTTGRIEGRALMPFGIQKGEFEKELSAETGLGLKAMRKEMEAGKIPIETTLNSLYHTITNKTGDDLGGVGTGMTDTLLARWAHLKERPDLFFENMKDTAGYHELSDFVAQVSEALDPKSALGQILSGTLEEAFAGLGDTLSTINLQEVVGDVAGFIKELPEDVRSASAFVRDDFVPAVKEAWQLFKDIVDFISTVKTGLGEAKDLAMKYTPLGILGDPLHSSQDRSQKALDIMARDGALPSQSGTGAFLASHVPGYQFLEDRVFNPHFWALRFGKETQQAGQNDMAGYSEGVLAGAPGAVRAMSTVADATVDALKTAHEQHSPSALFREIGELDMAGYVQGITGRQGDLEDVAESFDLASAAARGGGGGGTPSIVVEGIYVTVEGAAGGDSYEHGRLIARGMEDEVELMFLRIMERIAKRKGG